MQELLDISANYARKWRFAFNAEKSAVMILRETNERKKKAWRLGDLTIQETDEYTYLGALINSRTGISEGHMRLNTGKAFSTIESLKARAILTDGTDPTTTRMFLRTIISPILNKAAGVLPVAEVRGFKKTGNQLNKNLKQIGRKLLGVGWNESGAGVLQELRILDAKHQHGVTILTFYGYLVSIPATRPAAQMCRAALAPGSKSKWGKAVRYWASTLEVELPNSLSKAELDKWKRKVKEAARHHGVQEALNDIASSSRLVPLSIALSDPALVRRIWLFPDLDPLSSWAAPMVQLIRALRLGCLPLRDSLRQHGRSDLSPLCPVCNGGPETALHFLLECEAFEPERMSLEEELRMVGEDVFFTDLEKHGAPRQLQWLLQLPVPGCLLPAETCDLLYQAFGHFVWRLWALRRKADAAPEVPLRILRAELAPPPLWRWYS